MVSVELFEAALRVPRPYGAHLLEPEVGRGGQGEKKGQKVIVKVSTPAFILYRSPASSAKPSGQLPLINFCNLDQNQYRNWAAAGARGGGGACRC